MTQTLPKTLPAFFWHFIKPHKGKMTFLFVTGFVWAAQNSLTPYLLKLIIDKIANFHGNKGDIFYVVWQPAVAYVLLWLFMAFIWRSRDFVILKFLPSLRRDIINAMFAYLNQHSTTFLQNNFAGSLSNKIMDMAGSTASLFNRVDEASANILAFVVALASMWLVHPVFALILLGWVIIFITISCLFTPKIRLLSKVFSESKSILSGKIVDSVTNITNMRLFARHHYENTRLDHTVIETIENDRAVQFYILKMRIFWDISIITLLTAMLSALIFMWGHGKVTIGDFSFIMTVALNMFMNIWNIASQFVQFAEELGKCSQALTIINAPHDIIDSENAVPLRVTHGEIMFDDVTFTYNRNNNLFSNKTITIPAGQKVGLVGFSGSGKTTFVNLILRFFDIESGHILIDGQDIARVTQDSLHEQISMIPQDTSLFHRSLMENIRYGRLDASDDEVIEASKKAHCHEFISELEEGYHALVGERGIKLSGGQRQRIAIARAILKHAPILILDEATSALDSVTERYIQESLHALMHETTTIVIAHRLSTLSEMDRILVFDKGQVIEDGNHQQLLQMNGHYASMWHMQAGGFLPEHPHDES